MGCQSSSVSSRNIIQHREQLVKVKSKTKGSKAGLTSNIKLQNSQLEVQSLQSRFISRSSITSSTKDSDSSQESPTTSPASTLGPQVGNQHKFPKRNRIRSLHGSSFKQRNGYLEEITEETEDLKLKENPKKTYRFNSFKMKPLPLVKGNRINKYQKHYQRFYSKSSKKIRNVIRNQLPPIFKPIQIKSYINKNRKEDLYNNMRSGEIPSLLGPAKLVSKQRYSRFRGPSLRRGSQQQLEQCLASLV